MGEVTQHIVEIEKILKHGLNEMYSDMYKNFEKITNNAKGYPIEIPEKYNELLDLLAKYDGYSKDYQYIPISNKLARYEPIEKTLASLYPITGSYFRLFYQMIKYINDNVTDSDAKKNYLVFLRSTVNQEELFVLFYHAAYTNRGAVLLNELQQAAFFGTKKEIEANQYFDKEALFWREEDINIMTS